MSVTTLYAATAAGAAVALRHSFEPDHFAAVATLVDDERSDARKAGYVGASWGAGHSLPIILGAVVLILLGVRIPHTTEYVFEIVAGIILVALGARTLLDAGGYVRHSHPSESHDEHGHGHDHTHLKIGSLLLGGKHSHYKEESFLVGVLHGFAGTGILVVLVTAAAPTTTVAVGFVGAFTVVTVVSMAVIALLWGRLVSVEKAGRYLRVFGGVLGVGVGLVLVASGAGLADIQTHTHDHGTIGEKHAMDVSEFGLIDRETGEVTATEHGHWHGSVPSVEEDEHVSLGAEVTGEDGEVRTVGEDGYELRAEQFGEDTGTVSFEHHGDHVHVTGEEEGTTEITFRVLADDGETVYETPPVPVRVGR